jgi:hypothetical protein
MLNHEKIEKRATKMCVSPPHILLLMFYITIAFQNQVDPSDRQNKSDIKLLGISWNNILRLLQKVKF